MKKIFSNKKYRGRAVALSLVVILCVVGGVFGIGRMVRKPALMTNAFGIDISMTGHKEAGDVESIMEYGGNYNIVMHYPVFKNAKVDEVIYGDVSSAINEFKARLGDDESIGGMIHGDYEAFLIDESYISVKLKIDSSVSSDAHPDIVIKSYVFDVDSGSRLALADIVANEQTSSFIKQVIQKVKELKNYNSLIVKDKDISEYILGNPHCIILDKNGITIRFDKYSIMPGSEGNPQITIEYKDANQFFKPGFKVEMITDHLDGDKQDDHKEIPIVAAKREIDPNRPMVALTFDDGPHKEHTIEILNSLRKYNGAATFYMLGNRAASYGEIVEQIVKSGSEAGNHSWSHNKYTKLSGEQVRDDAKRSKDAIVKFAKTDKITLRAPYGAVNDTVKQNVHAPVVLWSVDTNDWKEKDTAIVIERATTNIKDGDIILMHDIWPSTSSAVDEIAKRLTNQGFQLVTVSEMAKARNIELKDGVKYFSFKK